MSEDFEPGVPTPEASSGDANDHAPVEPTPSPHVPATPPPSVPPAPEVPASATPSSAPVPGIPVNAAPPQNEPPIAEKAQQPASPVYGNTQTGTQTAPIPPANVTPPPPHVPGPAPVGAAAAPQPSKKSSGKFGLAVLFAILGAVVGAILGIVIVFAVLGVTPSDIKSAAAGGPVKTSNSSQPVSDNSTGSINPVKVAQEVVPSVVNIDVTSSATNPYTGQQGASDTGSGVILTSDGYIITNYHVVADGSDITVTAGNKDYKAKVVGTDSSSDIAVIKIDAKGLNPIEVGNSANVEVGQWVMAVGSPFGLEKSVTTGIVSALKRSETMQQQTGTSVYSNMIQIDAPINPGNSGGALVNGDGKLIGINTLIQSTSGSSAGVGFAIPSDYAIEIANQLIKTGSATHPYIGVSLVTVDPSTAQQFNLSTNSGAYVAEVKPNSPAAKAGIKPGDVITSYNGQNVSSADDLIVDVRGSKPGDKITVKYKRGDKNGTATVTLGTDTSTASSSQQQNSNQ